MQVVIIPTSRTRKGDIAAVICNRNCGKGYGEPPLGTAGPIFRCNSTANINPSGTLGSPKRIPNAKAATSSRIRAPKGTAVGTSQYAKRPFPEGNGLSLS